jgi:hypothetical protein
MKHFKSWFQLRADRSRGSVSLMRRHQVIVSAVLRKALSRGRQARIR